jgi:hypothetical protein
MMICNQRRFGFFSNSCQFLVVLALAAAAGAAAEV